LKALSFLIIDAGFFASFAVIAIFRSSHAALSCGAFSFFCAEQGW